jgi:hypothetical protein
MVEMDRLCALVIAEVPLMVLQASFDQTGRVEMTAENALYFFRILNTADPVRFLSFPLFGEYL